MDDFKERRTYWKLKEEVPDRILWTAIFGIGYGPVVRQTTEWIIVYTVRLLADLTITVETKRDENGISKQYRYRTL